MTNKKSPFFFLLLQILLLISTTTTTTTTTASPAPPRTTILAISSILSTLNYGHLTPYLSGKSLTTPLTIFAPSASSLQTCPTCNHSLLLLEHSVPNLYPLPLLQSLPFGTKLQSLSPHLRCLTLTSSSSTAAVFVNGNPLTHPNLFVNNRLIIHGLHGFLSHLSPLSCNLEFMTSLSFPSLPLSYAPFATMRLMLNDAMLRLRLSGYGVAALAIRERYRDLVDLRAATVFVLDDEAVFKHGGGGKYLADLEIHVVPNRRMTAPGLVALEAGTEIPTMRLGEKLVVTTAGGGGLKRPMRINYVRVRTLDLLFNTRVAVHALGRPLRRYDGRDIGRSGFHDEAMAPNTNTTTTDDAAAADEEEDYASV